jgi:pSer/pThr/pTyr-binding forkhead associated (FHA) protein
MGSFQLEYGDNGEVFSFTGESITIGRAESSDFVLDHPTVSREHAEIVDEGGGRFRIVVLSRNGLTALGGERVEESAPLRDGHLLHFGKLEFVFQSNEAVRRSPSGGGRARSSEHEAPDTRGDRARDRTGEGRRPAESSTGDRVASDGTGEGSRGGGRGDSPIDEHTEEDIVNDIVGDTPHGEGGHGIDESDQARGGGGDQMASPATSDGLEAEPEPESPPSEEEEDDSAAEDITSWDDIAATAEPDESEQSEQKADPDQSFASSMRNQSSAEEEETDQRVVVGGLGLAVLFLLWSFWPGGGGGGGVGPGAKKKKAPPLTVRVQCIGAEECKRKAIAAYQSGEGYYKRRSAKIGNLFNAYRKMYEAKKYLEKGKIKQRPPELKELKTTRKKIRKHLDQKFQNFKVEYHIAKKEDRYVEMAQALLKVQKFFHDEGSREYQWARKRKLEMKNRGQYPSQYEIRRGL